MHSITKLKVFLLLVEIRMYNFNQNNKHTYIYVASISNVSMYIATILMYIGQNKGIFTFTLQQSMNINFISHLLCNLRY